jgi:hypothetical protein
MYFVSAIAELVEYFWAKPIVERQFSWGCVARIVRPWPMVAVEHRGVNRRL